MTTRVRLLAALLAERFDTAAIESEAIVVLDPSAVRIARVTVEADRERQRRAQLRGWPEPTPAQLRAVPARPPRAVTDPSGRPAVPDRRAS